MLFLWIILGIASVKIFNSAFTTMWLCRDTHSMRKWLTRAMLLNAISSATITLFGLIALTLLKEVFWPHGLTDGGFVFNLKISMAPIIPAFAYSYFYSLAKQFEETSATD